MTPGEIAPKRLISTENGVNKHSRAGERNDHQELTHQTTLPPGRDEWKASTRTEGDSTEPSVSMATRTCRKAGARDKHTGDAETTPCSARGEEERFEQAPGKRPEERTGLLDSAIQPRHRQSGGRPPSRNCKRKPPGGENLCRTPTKNHGATTTPKEKGREKNGRQVPKLPH